METKKVKKMVPAVIDQLMMWIVIFVSFVTILFFVIDYSMIMRIKGNIDLMSQYAARMISLGNTEDEVASSLNNIKINYFADISGGDIVCNTSATGTYQVIFNLTGLYVDTNILDQQNNILSKKVVFNEINSDEIECSLTLQKQ